MFKEEIRKQEFYVTRIREKCDQFGLPQENVNILVKKWEIVRRKITVVERRLWKVASEDESKGNLSSVLMWLQDAESMLDGHRSGAVERRGSITGLPTKYKIEQHEVSTDLLCRLYF